MEFFHLKFDYFDQPHSLWKAQSVRAASQRYLVLIEAGLGHLCGFVPDVPGCAAIGHTLVQLRENLHDALEHRLEQAALEGRPLPLPSMGRDDVPPGTPAEWMTVRICLGIKIDPLATVRPCPAR